MRCLILLILCAASVAKGSLSVDTSWLHGSEVILLGGATEPPQIEQDFTGDPSTIYSEDYSEELTRNGPPSPGFALIDYTFNSSISGSGLVDSYQLNSDATVFAAVQGISGDSASFQYEAQTTFSSDKSFSLSTGLYINSGNIENFSFYINDELIWDIRGGFATNPFLTVYSELVAVYEDINGYTIELFAIRPSGNDGVYVLDANATAASNAPSAEFNVMMNWGTEYLPSESGVALFDYELSLTAIPEPSTLIMALFITTAMHIVRKRPSQEHG